MGTRHDARPSVECRAKTEHLGGGHIIVYQTITTHNLRRDLNPIWVSTMVIVCKSDFRAALKGFTFGTISISGPQGSGIQGSQRAASRARGVSGYTWSRV